MVEKEFELNDIQKILYMRAGSRKYRRTLQLRSVQGSFQFFIWIIHNAAVGCMIATTHIVL